MAELALPPFRKQIRSNELEVPIWRRILAPRIITPVIAANQPDTRPNRRSMRVCDGKTVVDSNSESPASV